MYFYNSSLIFVIVKKFSLFSDGFEHQNANTFFFFRSRKKYVIEQEISGYLALTGKLLPPLSLSLAECLLSESIKFSLTNIFNFLFEC